MEPAAATADFESQPGVLPTATESQPDPFVSVEEPSQAFPASNEPTGTVRPRRGDKTPASFADYAIIKPVRGRPVKKRIANVQPVQEEQGQQQQQEQVEHDDLSTALDIPGFPALPDLGAAVREFMLGDGPKLSAPLRPSSSRPVGQNSRCLPCQSGRRPPAAGQRQFT